ncbi:hypothetical protein H4R35_002180 [Dimargaris xerosporica]|nr:hypothetical protein H4R35_002180 [Dimargaris xerosporica]
MTWPVTYATLRSALESVPAQASTALATNFDVLYQSYAHHPVYSGILRKLPFRQCDNKFSCLFSYSAQTRKLAGMVNDAVFILLRHASFMDIFPFFSTHFAGELRALVPAAGESIDVDYSAIHDQDMQQFYPVLYLSKAGQCDIVQMILVTIDVQTERLRKSGELTSFLKSQLHGASILLLKGWLSQAHPAKRDLMRRSVQALRRDTVQAAMLDLVTTFRQDKLKDWGNRPSQALADAGASTAIKLQRRTKVNETWLNTNLDPAARQLRSLLQAFPTEQQAGAPEMVASWAFGLGLPLAPYILAPLIRRNALGETKNFLECLWKLDIMDREGVDAMAFQLYRGDQLNTHPTARTSSVKDLGPTLEKQAMASDQRQQSKDDSRNRHTANGAEQVQRRWAMYHFQSKSTTRSKCLDRFGLAQGFSFERRHLVQLPKP